MQNAWCEIYQMHYWGLRVYIYSLQWLVMLDTIASCSWDPFLHETVEWEDMKASALTNCHASQIPCHHLEKN
jgi:hypothetical protein